MRQEIGANPGAVVLDDQFNVSIHSCERYLNVTVLWSEFRGIGKKIPDDLLKPEGIAP